MINDIHCHFFSSPFLEVLSQAMDGLPESGRAAIVAARLGWSDPGSPEALSRAWVNELDRHHVARAALIASIPGDEDSVAEAVRHGGYHHGAEEEAWAKRDPLDRTQRFLYSAHGDSDETCAYRIDEETGRLTFINKQPNGGDNSSTVAVDASNRYPDKCGIGYWTSEAPAEVPNCSPPERSSPNTTASSTCSPPDPSIRIFCPTILPTKPPLPPAFSIASGSACEHFTSKMIGCPLPVRASTSCA